LQRFIYRLLTVEKTVEQPLKQEDGKFVVMRDPNKAVVRIYSVPMSTFEEDSDDEQDNANDDNEDED
jgi:translation initiation factor 3 subunit D